LTHAIGIDDQKTYIEYMSGYIYEDDRYFLCSDGVNKIYSDSQLTQKLSHGDTDSTNNTIITHAPNGYIPDNISSIIIDII